MGTHVIEIVGGIGEPGFVPLTMGKESPTLSIGRRAQWRVEGAGILDIHAYAYFDGQALFLQSADANNAACVDGFPVGTSWTEVRPPCTIELGGARLEYREEDSSDDATQAIANPGLMQPPAMRPATPAPAAGRPPEHGSSNVDTRPPPPQAQPTARPFQPGAFSGRQEEDAGESTRVAPLDVSSSRAGPRPSGAFGGVQQPTAMSGYPAQQGFQPNPHMMQRVGSQPGMPMMDPNGYPMQQPIHHQLMQQPIHQPIHQPMGPSGSGGFPMQQPVQSGYAPFGSGSVHGAPMSGYPDGSFGNPPGQRPQEEDALKKAIADFKAASPVRKLILILFPMAMVAAGMILLGDDPPPPKPAKADAGAQAGSVAAMEAGAPTSDMFVPQGPVVPVPLPVPTPTPPTSAVVPTPTPVPPTGDAGPGKNLATLERRAIDEVYRGDVAKAAETYEQLAREQPANPSYAYAAKILREKLANGAPAPAPPPSPGAPR
jgi:hypothetical protein